MHSWAWKKFYNFGACCQLRWKEYLGKMTPLHPSYDDFQVPSSRRPSSTIFKDLLWNRLANQTKFYVDHPWEGGTIDCINGPGHMAKMAAMLIYGKNL